MTTSVATLAPALPVHPHQPRGVLRLPFTIAPVSTREQLRDVLALRHAAYGRHGYTALLKQSLLEPDDADLCGASTTFVAVSKATGQLLGTLRVQSSLDAPVHWPEGTPDDPCREGAYTYIDRFAAAAGDGEAELTASALIKAAYLWSLARDSYFATALARPALARMYRRLGGMTTRGDGRKVEMPDYHRQPYLLLGTPLHEVRGRLQAENPAYSAAFFDKVHPDIAVNAMSIPWRTVVRPALELVHA